MNIFTPKNGFISLTRQYVGGLVAGFGLGAIMMKYLVHAQGARVVETPLFSIAAFLFIAVGGSLALAAQRRLAAAQRQ